MSTTATGLLEQAQRDNVAALKYLFFLEQERRWLIAELYPNTPIGDQYFAPIDQQVTTLDKTSTLSRARLVLETLGVNPDGHDPWVDSLPAAYAFMRSGRTDRRKLSPSP
jgi:hypothetical protein